jgi:DNA-3-methyladenine glycosylase
LTPERAVSGQGGHWYREVSADGGLGWPHYRGPPNPLELSDRTVEAVTIEYAWLAAPASDVVQVTASLLGWELAANGVRIRLTEAEAYAGMIDPASHAYRGPTPRNKVMFGPAGAAYLYYVFGAHWCLNLVLGEEGVAAAALLRAGTVIDGIELARKRRPNISDRNLARGPANLVRALGVDGSAYGTSMVDGSGPLHISPPSRPVEADEIAAGPRVGVTSAHDVAWRFWISGDPTVSAYRRHSPRRRT